jgi:hypothetical protein
MEVKYYLAKGGEADQSMKHLLALARTQGANGISSLINDARNGNLSLTETKSALVIVGGRESIRRSLMNSGGYPTITGTAPLKFCFARKHRIFGKNETCLKVVAGQGHTQPEDGSEFMILDTQSGGGQFSLTPPQFSVYLYSAYGW